MKTIVARFTEMKKAPGDIVEVDGEEVSVNKVEQALQSVGVQLRDTTGEFRNLDDVFLELASKWDTLDVMSQRYIATTAAGSRQSSRFIAMMSNYQRTLELTSYATNSAGASQKQFEKTTESLESKLNKLHNAWEQFTTGIANQTAVKGIVDLLTNLLTTINNVTDALDFANTGLPKLLTALLGFKAAKSIVNGVLKNIGTQMATGMGINGEKAATSFFDRFYAKMKKVDVTLFGDTEVKQQAAEAEKVAAAKRAEAIAAQENLEAEQQELIVLKQQVEEARKVGLEQRLANGDSLNGGITEAETDAIKINNAAKVQSTVVTKAKEEATKKETEAIIAEETAEETRTKAEKMGLLTKIKYYAMLLFGNEETRKSALAAFADAGAKWAQAKGTTGAAAAQSTLNAAMLACPVGWILVAIAAVTALMVGVCLLVDAINETDTERYEKWSKTLEELNDQLADVNTRVNELQDGWSTLLDTKKSLEELTEGTLEWKQKLLEVNQQVLDLINKMPELTQFITASSNGELEVSQTGYEYILKKQIDGAERLQNAVLLAQAEKAEAQTEIDKNTYINSFNKSFSEKESAKISYQSSSIEMEQLTSVAFEQLLKDYEENHNVLSDNNKLLAKEVLANKKNLKIINDKQRSVKADKALYGQLVGLTESQVQEQLDNEELTEDTIKATIAINEYQKEYAAQLQKLSLISISLTDKQKNSLIGTESLKESELKSINTTYLKQFQNDLGEIDLSNNSSYEKAKVILGQELNLTSVQLSELENAGVDFEQIISNLLDGEQKLSNYWSRLDKLTNKSKQTVNEYVSSLEGQIGSELSVEQLDAIGSFVEKVVLNGGNVQKSIEAIDTLFKDVKDSTKLKEILSSLDSLDMNDDNFVDNLTSKLKNLGVECDTNVVTQLNSATKAADKFNLSNFTEQLTSRNVAYADALKRKKDNDVSFTKEEYEQYSKAAGDTDISGFFFENDDETYTLISGWDELIKILYNTTERVKEITQTTDDYNAALKKVNTTQEAVESFGGPYKKWEYSAKNAAKFIENKLTLDEDGNFYDFGSGIANEVLRLIINPVDGEDLANRLLGRYEGVGAETEEEVTASLKARIKELLDAGDTEILAYLPKQVIDAISDIIPKELLSKYGQGNQYLDYDISEDFEQTIKKVKKIPGISDDLISELETLKDNPTEFKEKLNDLLKEYSNVINGTSLSSIQHSQEQALIRGAQSARELVDLRQNGDFNYNNAENLELYDEKLTSLVSQHKDWQKQLQTIQDEYGYTKEAALEVLAVQYEQESAVDNIISTLGDYEGVFTEPEGKGTTKYIEGISSLVEDFQKIYGEDIDSTWVEENLEDIMKLKEDGEEAEAAMKRLGETSKAQNYSIDVKVNTDFEGKDETIFSKLSSAFDSLSTNAETNSDIAQTKIGEIKEALEDLNGSNVSFEVKAKTKAAFADLIRTGIARAAVEENIPLLNYLVDLAYSGGFQVGGMRKIIEANVVNGKVSYTFSNDAENWTDFLQITPWAEDENGNLVYDKNGNPTTYSPTTTHTFKQKASGSGDTISTNSSNKTTTETSTWTNDWDRQYSTLKKIESLEKRRNQLSKQQTRYQNSALLNEQRILENKEKQRKNLEQQVELNEQLVQDADSWLQSLNSSNSFGGAIYWDASTGTLHTDDAYIRSLDESTKSEFDTVKSEYESYISQRNTALDNIDTAVDAIEDLTSTITELDYHNNIERLISVIERTIDLYDKAQDRLEWSERSVTSQGVADLYSATGEELVKEFEAYSDDYIQTSAEINAKLHKSDYQKYFNADWTTGEVTTTAAYDALIDTTVKDKVKDFVTELNNLFQRRNDADTKRVETQDKIRSNQKDLLDEVETFQKNVYDAIVSQREAEISNLESINTSIQNAASDLVSSIQKNIQKIRQDRTNKKTEEEISKMQSRLDFLQMDTSSGNQKTILDLKKQLEDKEQSYTDSLIDQKISELQDQNTEAEKQRKKQIEIAQAQLDYQKNNGLIWGDALSLISAGLAANGNIEEGSELDTTLKEWGKYYTLSEQGKKDWLHEQNLGSSRYKAYYDLGLKSTDYNDQVSYSSSGARTSYEDLWQNMINSYKQGLVESINNTSPYNDYMYYNPNTNIVEPIRAFPGEGAYKDLIQNAYEQAQDTIDTIRNINAYFEENKKNKIFTQTPTIARYATGGLADYTGPAWLDGTPSSPELVLNARDTQNFIQLKDVLSNIMNRGTSNTDTSGDYYFEIHIDVDKITNDYDVDKMAERIKQQITNSARYRNVNAINSLR